MSAVKFLEKKAVIRGFGIALLLAPFVNATLAILSQKKQNPLLFSRMSWIQILNSGSTVNYALAIGSLVLGFIMLRGSTKAWKAVLILLGLHILLQLFNLAENIRQNWIWGLFFVINASVFMFIADQLVFKLKLPEADPLPKVVAEKKMARVPIGFKDWGIWAELVDITRYRLRVRRLNSPPPDIEQRLIQIKFKGGVQVRARYNSHMGSEYYFEFIGMTPEQDTALVAWIKKNAA
jgi:hypothetical protein